MMMLMEKVFIIKYSKQCSQKMQQIKSHVKDMVVRIFDNFFKLELSNLLMYGFVRSTMDHVL